MPADPVAAITGKMANGMSDASAVQEIYERYAEQFGTNKPMAEQFLIFCKNAIHGDFGLSFSQYPRSVSNIISSAIMWTICLQLPAILVGWLLGNLLGALAAYISDPTVTKFQPMNVNFSIIAPLEKRVRKKSEKNLAISQRSLEIIDTLVETGI